MKPHRLHRAPFVRLVALIVALCGPAVFAHEVGTARVAARLGPTGYEIEVVIDPVTLLSRLEAAAGLPRSGYSLAPGDYRARIESLQWEFIRHVQVRFDDRPVQPRVVSVTGEATASNGKDAAIPPVTVLLAGEIPGGALTFSWGSSLMSSTYAFTVTRGRNEPPVTEWLDGPASSGLTRLDVPSSFQSRARVFQTYAMLGFTHIVPKGVDHILFVLGLFLFSRRVRALIWQVTAFTVAHSITLGLSLYGIVAVRPSIVEPLIAASIAYVAIENIVATRLTSWRIALVFVFGLLHGLGFAGVLVELGLPRSEFLTGLFAFNCGVEAGQLTVIGSAYVLATYFAHTCPRYRDAVVLPGSALIAIAGLCWTLVRVL
jgi:hypothetical protein